MSRITIILPIHEVNDELKTLYKNAIGSIPISDEGKSMYPVLVVGPKKVIEQYKDEKLEKIVDITYLANEKSGFQDQINAGAKACETDFFSGLEIDDMVTFYDKTVTAVAYVTDAEGNYYFNTAKTCSLETMIEAYLSLLESTSLEYKLVTALEEEIYK